MSENNDRIEIVSRAVENLEDGVEIAGGGEEGNEGNSDTAAEEFVPDVLAEPRSYD